MPTLVDFTQRRGKGRGFESLRDALWSRVIPGSNGCLIHDGQIEGKNDYSRISFKGKRYKAHRVAWELRFGKIGADESHRWGTLELDHLPACDKRCVNTDHLTPRTRSEHQSLTMRRPEERPKNLGYLTGECSIDGCDREDKSRGLCNMHYQRQRNGVPMGLPPMSRTESGRRAAAVRWKKG